MPGYSSVFQNHDPDLHYKIYDLPSGQTILRVLTPEQEKNLRKYVLNEHWIISFGIPYASNGKVYVEYDDNPELKRIKSLKHDEINFKEIELLVMESLYKGPTALRHCERCHFPYLVRADTKMSSEPCNYHPGKLRSNTLASPSSRFSNLQQIWSCCKALASSDGCTVAYMGHIWSGLTLGRNGPLDGYVKTKFSPEAGPYGVYGLKCETASTTAGRELARVVVVNFNGTVILDNLVRPRNLILDCHTDHSGIRMEDLNEVTTSLEEVQQKILTFVSAQTILVGHDIAGDLRALKIIHENIIETAHLYPHPNGFPYKTNLNILALRFLQKNIYNASKHDLEEDAVTPLKLVAEGMLRKIKIPGIEQEQISKKSLNFRRNYYKSK